MKISSLPFKASIVLLGIFIQFFLPDACLFAQDSSIHVKVLPTFLLPVAGSADLFTAGGGAALHAGYSFGLEKIQPSLGLKTGYYLAPFKADDSVSIVDFEGQVSAALPVGNRFELAASAGGGYYYGFINSDGFGGGNPSLSAGVAFSFMATPLLNLIAKADYQNYWGLNQGIYFQLGTSFHITGRDARLARIQSANTELAAMLSGALPDVAGKGLELGPVSVADIFPVFLNHYDMNPIGTVTIVNEENKQLDGISLSFFLKQYMDSPKACPVPGSIGPNGSIEVDLKALFTDAILGVTEASKTNAEITLEYDKAGRRYRLTRNITATVLDRNAMRWDDDRKAAAFVTAKDPRVLSFAKNIVTSTRDHVVASVDKNFQMGMALFKALDVYGLSYVIDPKSPFVATSKEKGTIDYLQFPRQTLDYHAGDCDDLSILYAALLESIGIETAFITVPGHIFIAFALDVEPASVGRVFTSSENLITREGRAWIPVEVTERRLGFMAAWEQGAKEWRDASSSDAAGFLPIREAWAEYAPVGLPGNPTDQSVPSFDRVASAFSAELVKFINREIAPVVLRLESEIARTNGSPLAYNRLGILYARYGKLEDAEKQFLLALEKVEHMPAVHNLGNLYLMKLEYEKAAEHFRRVLAADSGNVRAMLGLSSCHFEQGHYAESQQLWKEVFAINPQLASEYAHLNTIEDSAARGDATATSNRPLLWSD